VRFTAGKSAACGAGSAAVATLTERVLNTMFLHKLKLILGMALAATLAATGIGVLAQQASRTEPRGTVTTGFSAPGSLDSPVPAKETRSLELPAEPAAGGPSETTGPDQETASEKYGDGQPDGKKSLGGSGEMIEFSVPAGPAKVVGVRIHGSRYGQVRPPQESFLIYFMSHDLKRILHTEMAPYSLFERGDERWVDVTFERPVAGLDASTKFWLVLDFRATQTKGVYVSFDTSTKGEHSRVGLPGTAISAVNFGGDWMIEAKLAP
jgi:hypothetical protein